MKNLAKILLGIGVIALGSGSVSKLINMPIFHSMPNSILAFADSCFLLAIALILLEERR